MTPARAQTRTTQSGVERTNHEATVPPRGPTKKSNGLELSDKSSKNGNPLPHIINKKTQTKSLPKGHIDNIILQFHCIVFV